MNEFTVTSVENRLNHLHENYIFGYSQRNENGQPVIHHAPLITTDLKCVTHPENFSGIDRVIQNIYVLCLKLFGKLNKTNVSLNIHKLIDSNSLTLFKKRESNKAEELLDRLSLIVADLKERFGMALQESLTLATSKISQK